MPKALAVPSRRVGLTVPHSLNETLKRIAELQGKSKSGLVLEFLLDCEPVFEELLAALEVVEKEKALPLQKMHAMQQRALSTLSETMKDFNLQLDLGSKPE